MESIVSDGSARKAFNQLTELHKILKESIIPFLSCYPNVTEFELFKNEIQLSHLGIREILDAIGVPCEALVPYGLRVNDEEAWEPPPENMFDALRELKGVLDALDQEFLNPQNEDCSLPNFEDTFGFQIRDAHESVEEFFEQLPFSILQIERGSPEDQINSIEVEIATDLDEHFQCDICRTHLREGESFRSIPLYQYYHKDCLDLWVRVNNAICPMSRPRLFS